MIFHLFLFYDFMWLVSFVTSVIKSVLYRFVIIAVITPNNLTRFPFFPALEFNSESKREEKMKYQMRLAPLNLANRQCDLWINSIWCDMKIKTITRAAHACSFQADFLWFIIIFTSFTGMRLPHVKYFVIGISSKFHLMSVKLLWWLFGIFFISHVERVQGKSSCGTWIFTAFIHSSTAMATAAALWWQTIEKQRRFLVIYVQITLSLFSSMNGAQCSLGNYSSWCVSFGVVLNWVHFVCVCVWECEPDRATRIMNRSTYMFPL